jgi:hypothetical protein
MRPFVASDVRELNAWLAVRGIVATSEAELGKVGLIVPDVACGFLLGTDAREFAVLDGFCTNPAATLAARHEAIWAIMTRLIEEAKSRGISRIGGFTLSSGMGKVAKRVGLEHVGEMAVYRMVV